MRLPLSLGVRARSERVRSGYALVRFTEAIHISTGWQSGFNYLSGDLEDKQ